MRVYVAGAYTEREMIAEYIARLIAAGVEITFDWPANIVQAGKPDHEFTHEERQLHSEKNIKGIEDADVFWLLIPSGASKGAWLELGYAHALMRWRPASEPVGPHRIAVVVSGAAIASNFTSMRGTIFFHDHEAAYAELAALGRLDTLPACKECGGTFGKHIEPCRRTVS